MSDQKPSPKQQKKAKNPHPDVEKPMEKEIGGFADQGLKEPTRYGDWDVNGRCSDF